MDSTVLQHLTGSFLGVKSGMKMGKKGVPQKCVRPSGLGESEIISPRKASWIKSNSSPYREEN